MSLTRTNDAAFLNHVANHPDVRPWLGTDGASFVDVGVLLDLPGAFALTNEHGGFVFTPDGEGGFEFHTQFLPSGRGRVAMAAAIEARDRLFAEFGAVSLKTYVPHGNAAARWLVRCVGFAQSHEDVEQSYWRLDRKGWEARASR